MMIHFLSLWFILSLIENFVYDFNSVKVLIISVHTSVVCVCAMFVRAMETECHLAVKHLIKFTGWSDI